MNDLLSRSFHGSSAADLEAQNEMEMAPPADPLQARFHAEVAALVSDMEIARELLEKLRKANEDSKAVTSSQAMKALRERMDGLVAEVLRTAKLMKSKLDALDKANHESRKIPGCEEGSATDRMRCNITGRQRDALAKLLKSFDELRERLKSDYRQTIERRYMTVMGEKPSEATIDQMIETGESETFLQRAVQSQGRGQIIGAIEEIQERHDTLKEIEKNLLELHQIFMDMAVLVDTQGSQLNSVQETVNRARSFIQGGTRRLLSAKKLQRNSRKWTCIAILILLIVIIIVVALLVSFLR